MKACFCFRLRKKHSIVLLFTNIFHFVFKDFLCLFSLANDLVTHTEEAFQLTFCPVKVRMVYIVRVEGEQEWISRSL